MTDIAMPQDIYEGIEYEQEDPAIYEEYAAELTRNGVEVRMPRPAYKPR